MRLKKKTKARIKNAFLWVTTWFMTEVALICCMLIYLSVRVRPQDVIALIVSGLWVFLFLDTNLPYIERKCNADVCKDNYDLFVEHEMELREHEAKLPKCSWCGEPIRDECCHKIGNELVCKACIDDTEVSTDDFIYE